MKAFGVLMGGFFSVSAFAYVPPSSFILSEATKAHVPVKAVLMEGTVTDLRDQSNVREVVRVDFQKGKIDAAYFNSEDQSVGGFESNLSSIHTLGKFWITLAMDPSTQHIRQAFEALNIGEDEKTQVSLSRVGLTVTYAWGIDPKVQFLKDEFLPVAYEVGGPTGQGITISDYATGTSVHVPKTVWIKQADKNTYRFDLKSVKTNAQAAKFQAATTAVESPLAKDWVNLVR